MAQLPTVDQDALATKADLTVLSQRMDDGFVALEQRIDDRIEASVQRLLAAPRGELNAAITSQTRTMIYTTGGAVVSLGGLALVLARLV